MVKYCTKCGNELDLDDNFCEKCGSPCKKKKTTNFQSYKCPNCGGVLEYNDELIDVGKCKYCDATILIDNITDESYKAKVNIKKMKHAEYMEEKNHEHKKEIENLRFNQRESAKKNKFKINIVKGVLIAIVCALAYYFLFYSYFASEEKKSIKQEQELQIIVEEVKELVNEEKFDEAYLKAKEIVYTENWSSEIEEKWNSTRRELIDYIIKEEKDKTGKSVHKPEKEGLFKRIFGK